MNAKKAKLRKSFSANERRIIRKEAMKYVESGIVLYLNFDGGGGFGYQARIYKFPGNYGERGRAKGSENFGKFYKTKFFAKNKYPTWQETAKAAKSWIEENQVE